MSKYTLDTYHASPIGSMDNYVRFAIANELAEANRLKVIELKSIIGKDSKITFDLSLTELEDRA